MPQVVKMQVNAFGAFRNPLEPAPEHGRGCGHRVEHARLALNTPLLQLFQYPQCLGGYSFEQNTMKGCQYGTQTKLRGVGVL